MIRPFVGNYRLSQDFGGNPGYYTQFLVGEPKAPLKGHNGQDYALPTGTDVIAPHDGEIIEVAFDQNGYGNYIKIENEQEGSVLAHLETVFVKVGFHIKKGEKLATSDNTGYSTGPHLHWGYYQKPRNRNNGYGGFIDQAPLIEEFSPAPVSGKVYTSEEYHACMTDREKLWKERDEAYVKLDNVQRRYETDLASYTGMKSLGYNSVDDVTNALKKLENENTDLKKENILILKRNATLATTLAESEKEDHTTAEAGLAAVMENKKLQEELAKLAQAIGIDPKNNNIINRALFLRETADKLLQKVRGEHDQKEKVKAEAKAEEKPKSPSGLTILMNIFNGILDTKGGDLNVK